MSQPIEEITDHLSASERALLDPAVRRDRSRVSALLTEDFIEFGVSGRIWNRAEILALLENEEYTPPNLEDLACRLIAPGVALVTYKAVRTDPQTGAGHVTLRSSIWVEEGAGWRLCFHQGTRVP
jgi:hypothetical protein